MAYKRKKLSPFQRSQRSHNRLMAYHGSKRSEKNRLLYYYHMNVLNKQNYSKKILPKEVRNNIYKSIVG